MTRIESQGSLLAPPTMLEQIGILRDEIHAFGQTPKSLNPDDDLDAAEFLVDEIHVKSQTLLVLSKHLLKEAKRLSRSV